MPPWPKLAATRGEAGVVDESLLAHRGGAGGDGVEGLVPGDRHEAGILVRPFFGLVRFIGCRMRCGRPVLHQAVRLHATRPRAGAPAAAKLGSDLGGTVDHLTSA